MKFDTNIERTISWTLLGVMMVLLVLQMRSLSIFPQPNSIRWFGDETWLMLEAKQQISTGIVRYPLAIGSTLESGKGLVLSMTWLSSFIYGLPVLLYSNSPVATGRFVTAALSILLLIALYWSSRSMGASRIATLTGMILLVSTRAFFFASHSARPDLFAGLIVLLFVAICTRIVHNKTLLTPRWWFVYGAIVVFFSLSSSIHLLTLLIPVALFFFWQIGGFKGWNNPAAALAGGVSVLGMLVLIYYATNGNLILFPSSVAPVQFHDVLSSIPIRRPFSRSVQISNIVIRFKQWIAEAPESFLLLAFLPFVWNRKSHSKHIFGFACAIVFLSWLLLEGAEINYSMHIMPLLFLMFALATTETIKRWKPIAFFLPVIAIVCCLFSINDSVNAYTSATEIAGSNRMNIQQIESEIAIQWHGSPNARLLSEPISLDALSCDTALDVMTDHFISFPTCLEPMDSFFTRESIDFAVLYNSPVYPKNRPRDDSFYRAVEHSGTLIGRYIGMSGDMGRDYFHLSTWQDTLLLFQFP